MTVKANCRQELRQELPNFVRYGVKRLSLFGSRTRGDAQAVSGLVYLEPGLTKAMDIQA